MNMRLVNTDYYQLATVVKTKKVWLNHVPPFLSRDMFLVIIVIWQANWHHCDSIRTKLKVGNGGFCLYPQDGKRIH
jgi:hypothetical protein